MATLPLRVMIVSVSTAEVVDMIFQSLIGGNRYQLSNIDCTGIGFCLFFCFEDFFNGISQWGQWGEICDVHVPPLQTDWRPSFGPVISLHLHCHRYGETTTTMSLLRAATKAPRTIGFAKREFSALLTPVEEFPRLVWLAIGSAL